MTDPDCPDENADYGYEIEDEDKIFVINPDPSETSEDSVDSTDVPDDGDDIYTYEELVEICEKMGMSPEMIDGVIIQLLIQHFSNPALYIFPEQLEGVIYTPDPETRTLSILPYTQWVPDQEIGEPSIIWQNDGQKQQRISIGDQFYLDSSRPEAEGFARQVSGSHKLMCIGKTDGQANFLASEIDQWLTSFTPWLIRDLPFFDFQIVGRSQPKPYEELGNRVGVALHLSYSYLWAWELVPAGPPLKAVTLSKDY